MKIQLTIYGLLLWTGLQAQESVDEVMHQIEMNNQTLKVMRQTTEAVKLDNRMGLNPANPKVEFGYLWGSPEAIGNRQDLSITQEFDFPTAYHYRRKMSESLNQQVDVTYQMRRTEVMLEARELCYQMVYLNAYAEALAVRLTHAEKIASAYHAMFKEGEANILERNKADLNLLNARKELEANATEQKTVLLQLAALNGGNPIEIKTTRLPDALVPLNFDDWFSQYVDAIPQYVLQKQGIEVNQLNEKLNKALNLPKVSAGYTLENVVGEQYQGVTVGLSIPLWENKNTVKKVKAEGLAAQSRVEDTRLYLYHGLKVLHEKALQLKRMDQDYQQALQSLNNTDLLTTALEAGEISILEYLMEIQIYYDTVNKALDVRRELQLAAARLQAYQP
ncbi:TolC family protein [Marinilabiliaceae bacterium JC017]|nr:TolC family protein [Marinilabiliaceae bacterium JC017]